MAKYIHAHPHPPYAGGDGGAYVGAAHVPTRTFAPLQYPSLRTWTPSPAPSAWGAASGGGGSRPGTPAYDAGGGGCQGHPRRTPTPGPASRGATSPGPQDVTIAAAFAAAAAAAEEALDVDVLRVAGEGRSPSASPVRGCAWSPDPNDDAAARPFTPVPPYKTFYHQSKRYRAAGGAGGRRTPTAGAKPARGTRGARGGKHAAAGAAATRGVFPLEDATAGNSTGSPLPQRAATSPRGSHAAGSRPSSRLTGRVDTGITSHEAVRGIYRNVLRDLAAQKMSWQSTSLATEKIVRQVKMMVEVEADATAPSVDSPTGAPPTVPHRLLTATAAGIIRIILKQFGRFGGVVAGLLDIVLAAVFVGYNSDVEGGGVATEDLIDLPLFSEAYHAKDVELSGLRKRCDTVMKTQRTCARVMTFSIRNWQGFSMSLLLRAWLGCSKQRAKAARQCIVATNRLRTRHKLFSSFLRWKRYVAAMVHQKYVAVSSTNNGALQEELSRTRAHCTLRENEVDKLKTARATHTRKNDALMQLYANERNDTARLKARLREVEGEAVSLADLAYNTISEVRSLLPDVYSRPDVDGLIQPILATHTLYSAAAASRASVASVASSKPGSVTGVGGVETRIAPTAATGHVGAKLAACFTHDRAGLVEFLCSVVSAACPELPQIQPATFFTVLRSFRHLLVLAGRIARAAGLPVAAAGSTSPALRAAGIGGGARGGAANDTNTVCNPDAYRTDTDRAGAFIAVYARLGGGEDLSADGAVGATDVQLLDIVGRLVFRYALPALPHDATAGNASPAIQRRVASFSNTDNAEARVALVMEQRSLLIRGIKQALVWQEAGAAVATATQTHLNRALVRQKRGFPLDPTVFRVLLSDLPFTVQHTPSSAELTAAVAAWEDSLRTEATVVQRVYTAYRYRTLRFGRAEWREMCKDLRYTPNATVEEGTTPPASPTMGGGVSTSGGVGSPRARVNSQACDAIFTVLVDGRPEARGGLSLELFGIGLVLLGCTAYQSDRSSHRGKLTQVLTRLAGLQKQLDLAHFHAVIADARVNEVLKASRPAIKRLFRVYAGGDTATTMAVDDAVRFLSDLAIAPPARLTLRTMVHAAVHTAAAAPAGGGGHASSEYGDTPAPVSQKQFAQVVLYGMLCQLGSAFTPPHQRLQAFVSEQVEVLAGETG